MGTCVEIIDKLIRAKKTKNNSTKIFKFKLILEKDFNAKKQFWRRGIKKNEGTKEREKLELLKGKKKPLK